MMDFPEDKFSHKGSTRDFLQVLLARLEALCHTTAFPDELLPHVESFCHTIHCYLNQELPLE